MYFYDHRKRVIRLKVYFRFQQVVDMLCLILKYYNVELNKFIIVMVICEMFCGMFFRKCFMRNVLCGMFYAEYFMRNILRGMFYMECFMWNDLCEMF